MKPVFYKKVTSNEAEKLRKNLVRAGALMDYCSIFETGLKNQAELGYDFIAGLGAKSSFNLGNRKLDEVDEFLASTINEWKFFQLNYNLFKSIYSTIKPVHKEEFEFDLLTIIIPESVVAIKNNELTIYGNYDLIEPLINLNDTNHTEEGKFITSSLIKSVNFNEYQIQFEKIQNYLQRGDIYEVNYCIPFKIKTASLNLFDIYSKQKLKSPAPYSCFLKHQNNYLLCASPERFINKKGSTISCYPMKGTIKKTGVIHEDDVLKSQLFKSEKERAENVMIVDLTRNDLSKIATKSSVSVKELFGVYEFPQVFQMISTVEARLKENTTFSAILKALFPMGSMTGAPKMNAIKIIDEVECFSRELFSGSVGYMDPNGDFDFNVVIRSILYNSEKQFALVAAGGAITVHSNAVDEYNECLLKANANLELLGINLSEIPLQ
jgi:para-aminobenzoate synthetase component 1